MTFEYLFQLQAQDSIDIDDIGNCSIRANNDSADEWYLLVKTSLGWTTIEEYGSLVIDSDSIGYSFNFSHKRFEYNEKKIYSYIDKWMNDPKKGITQIEEIETSDFYWRLRELKDDSDK